MNDAVDGNSGLLRYHRQTVFRALGLEGQRRLAAGRALIVGMGGLGTWLAELLARAGVGFLRIVDDDHVDLTNIHRQSLYDESDAAAARSKVIAAAERLAAVNSDVNIEPVAKRVDHVSIARLADDMDVLLDGTDNFATRYLINDYAVKTHRPWVFAGAVGAKAQTMTIVPGRTACLRCVLPAPPPACTEPTCRSAGVLGPAVAAVAAFQAGEAIKILAGHIEAISPYLLKFDMWANSVQRLDAIAARRSDCACCGHGEFEFLEP